MTAAIKSKVSEYFDGFKNYDSYYQGPWKCCRNKMAKIIKKVRPSKRIKILDLGCGRFSTLPDLLTDEDVDSYCCVDSSSESIRVLKDLYSDNKNFVCSQSDVVDFVKSSRERFDVIILFGTVMYLDRAKARELFLLLDNLLNNDGIVLLYEPNEKAKMGLDQYSHIMDLNWLNNVLNENGSLKIKQIHFLNILGLRKISYAIFSKLNKIFGVNIKNSGALNRVKNFSWKLEFGIENLLSKFKLGCDNLIIIKK